MKIKKQIIIGIMIIMIMLLIPNCSKAVEVSRFESTSGGSLWNRITISQAFQVCYDLREQSAESTLGTNKLDPHLTLNKDWGAVAYLTISDYGGNSGTKTTGNDTGIMEFGTKKEFTSSLIKNATQLDHPEYRTNLTSYKGTKYVEELESDVTTNSANSKGMALAETRSYVSFWDPKYPCFTREGVQDGSMMYKNGRSGNKCNI